MVLQQLFKMDLGSCLSVEMYLYILIDLNHCQTHRGSVHVRQEKSQFQDFQIIGKKKC